MFNIPRCFQICLIFCDEGFDSLFVFGVPKHELRHILQLHNVADCEGVTIALPLLLVTL